MLTVLDFVGYHRKEFRFDPKLRALTGDTRAGSSARSERASRSCPPGAPSSMDRAAQALVLDNIRSQIANRWQQIVAELRSYGDLDLRDSSTSRASNSATSCAEAATPGPGSGATPGLPTPPGSDREDKLLKRVRAFAHVDDPLRAAHYRSLLADEHPTFAGPVAGRTTIGADALFSLWPDGGGHESDRGRPALRFGSEDATRAEIATVVDLSFDAANHVTIDLERTLADVPFGPRSLPARRDPRGLGLPAQARTACARASGTRQEHNVDAFFVTLKKSEADYSPTTMYRDYPISPTLFHWESQSTTSVASATGQRYVSGTSTVLLFARHEHKDEFGTSPYLFLGPVHHVDHEGDRPIAITWRLEHPMPTDFFTSRPPPPKIAASPPRSR